MPERNPAAFAGVGSVRIHELVPVNELAEIRIVRSRAEKRSKNDGGNEMRTISSRAGFWIAGKPIDHRNRCVCLLR